MRGPVFKIKERRVSTAVEEAFESSATMQVHPLPIFKEEGFARLWTDSIRETRLT